MIIKKKWFKILPLFLLAAAIALSPSFSAGALEGERVIEIRVEDILIVILGLIWFTNFLISGKKEFKKPPLFLPILAWLGIGLFTVLFNWILGNLELSRGFFYFLKELEFFIIYFYVFYHIKNIDSAKFIIKLWIFLGLINAGYVFYHINAGIRSGQYGAGAICEWGVFSSGAFFLILFIFLFNIFFFYFFNLDISKFKKVILGAMIISPAIGVLGSISKTNFLGLILALFLSFSFFFLKKKRIKIILFAVLISIVMVGAFLFTLQRMPVASRIVDILRPSDLLLSFDAGRMSSIKSELEKAMKEPLLLPFFGYGKGYVGEAHNQYLRNFIEVGIMGSVIFLFLIFAIIKKAWDGFSKSRDPFSIGLSAGLLTATLTMLFISIATEAFIVVKPSEVYWFFTAITMAVLSINKGNIDYKERIN
ncbi:hypothetical protein AMJ49_04945 [Parcubacteria bacterium DG_74_2]|nr:MAG: hypothetical protein AMJ49_04945 [Parcubacteria bacterium DG_74_2]